MAKEKSQTKEPQQQIRTSQRLLELGKYPGFDSPDAVHEKEGMILADILQANVSIHEYADLCVEAWNRMSRY